MSQKIKNAFALVTAVLAGAMVTAPATASAQPVAYAKDPGPAIKGTIVSIPDKYEIQVRDRQGRLDTVSLHQGTIINPTGITLKPGFRVAIYGSPDGNTFAANEIDTPYHYRQPQVSFVEPDPFFNDPIPYVGWYAPAPIIVVRHP